MRPWIPLFIVCAVLGSALPASAQSEIDQARQNAERAAEASDLAREQAAEVRAKADLIVGELDAAAELVHDLEFQIEGVAALATAARSERDALQDGVADLLVLQYVYINRTEFIDQGAPSEQVRANALAHFANVGIGDEIDRFRVVTDDLTAAESALFELKAAEQLAIADLETKNAQLVDEIDEMVRLLDLAEAKEQEFLKEVSRLEETERLRLEAERAAAAEARRQAKIEEQRAAKAELDRQRAEAEARAATSVPQTTTTTTTAATSTTGASSETTSTTAIVASTDDGATGGAASTAVPSTTLAPTTPPPTTPPPTTLAPTTLAPTTTTSAPPASGFLCPISGATTFFDTWGAARSGGRSHKGVDMFAQRGTPVVAPVSGVVRHSSRSALAGLAFYLDGDDGERVLRGAPRLLRRKWASVSWNRRRNSWQHRETQGSARRICTSRSSQAAEHRSTRLRRCAPRADRR